ncbi:LAMI_0F08108g1_1 [Lachancea mirantina]|uniref:LAMI_0F08108g1_1 n=1 Tax=Lachancea mirantina TaxID=1230905 RepID=A0A1G4K072_9SACH|nr:LAMI_0F08108g1_1 [Lachancea mirantina]
MKKGPGSRRKTSVACLNCARAHVTCESKRPCSRCVKKGLESSCVDAPRKRRKYLADVPYDSLPVRIKQNLNSVEQQRMNGNGHILHRPKFMSNAADLEYSVLSDITQRDELVSKVPIELLYSKGGPNYASQYMTTGHTPSVLPPVRSVAVEDHRNRYGVLLGVNASEALEPEVDLFTTHFPLIPQDPLYGFPLSAGKVRCDDKVNQYYLSHDSRFPAIQRVNENIKSLTSLSLQVELPEFREICNVPEIAHTLRYRTPMEIYTLISQPFSHTPGFHSLLEYLKKRFDKTSLLEMCRSLAEFRPTFIAIAVTLTEEDMIFMEQCYQRTLLEYDQIISQIGTPTCVWRRNGQISYLNDEFTLLTGWDREDLIYKMTFIVEIMDDDSVREYFKVFSQVAYRDFKASEQMQRCRLLTPQLGQEIDCCCMWTAKRDVFGLPLMIVGNFMPLLETKDELL